MKDGGIVGSGPGSDDIFRSSGEELVFSSIGRGKGVTVDIKVDIEKSVYSLPNNSKTIEELKKYKPEEKIKKDQDHCFDYESEQI